MSETLPFRSSYVTDQQACSNDFGVALRSWQEATLDLENCTSDDESTTRLCLKTAIAVDTLMATPAPDIAGVLAKLDSMWRFGGEWSKDLTHRGHIIADLEALNVSRVSPGYM